MRLSPNTRWLCTSGQSTAPSGIISGRCWRVQVPKPVSKQKLLIEAVQDLLAGVLRRWWVILGIILGLAWAWS